MSLTPGTRLGSYEVTAAIGSGGMGEVYRATDTKLKRDVAIKVLPGSMAADSERLARFQREAEVLAALNHPHIAAIYGLEETGSGIALVMELVDGVTLGELIAAGTPETERVGARSKDHDGSVIPRGGGAPRGLNIDDALTIARQIADALEAAHERGIIHRDLKPANIKVRPDGTVKVLDFGLAKALGPDQGTGTGDVANSPTITTPAMTQVGMILGTAAYMAPEQARGRAVDKRADIWAFGCVLFEMLTGRRAFPGDDVTDTLAAVVKLEPDWTLIGADVPARVRKVLGVCLQKDPRQRGGDIAAIRLALGGAFDTVTGNAPATTEPRSGRRAWLVTAAAFIAGGLVVGGAAWSLRPTPEVRRVSRFEIEQLDGVPLAPGGGQVTRLALSPDGTKVAFLAPADASRGLSGRLLLRRLDGLGVTTLYQGAAANPFFSPDGNWVAFFAPEGQGSVRLVIRKVAVTGGPAITIGSITDASTPHGADWGEDDTIVFAMHNRGLKRMPGAGGTPEPLAPIPPTAQEGKEAPVDHREWPAFLPGARALLYSDRPAGGMGSDESRILVRDLDSGEERVLVSGGSFPQYARTGHLVYAYEGTLRTIGFDLDRLDVVGTPRPMLEGVVTKEEGAAEFRVSRDGSLVYLTGAAGGVDSATLVWRDRSGNETPFGAGAALAEAGHPRLSPDGTRLALSVARDIWVSFMDGRPPIRLTSGGDYLAPLWSPDGQRLVIEGDDRLWSIAADGSDSTPVEVSMPGHFHPHGWSDGGRDLIAVRMEQGGSPDIVRWPLTNPAEITPVLSTPAAEGPQGASLSPDGHWLAYVSNQTGSNEIWVRPYPGPGAPIRVSPNGGRDPVWARNGRELYYFSQQSLMAVAVRTGPTLSFDVPAALFQATPVRLSNQPPSFDVGGDGRFVMLKPGETDAPEPSRLVVVLNWSQELQQGTAAP